MRISLAGPLRLDAGERRVDDAGLGDQGRLVLAFLVGERHRPVSVEQLAEVVWEGSPPATWRTALRGLVSKVRSVLGACGLDRDQVVRSGPGWYQLVLPPRVVVDVEEAADAVASAEGALGEGRADAARQAAEAAKAVASRPFLVGASGSWVEGRQLRLDEVRLRALEALARACVLLGAIRSAVAAAEEAVALDPLRESAHVELMAAHAAGGNRAQALAAYERCRRLLVEELGISPSARTEAAYLQLLGDEEPSGAGRARPDRPVLPLAVTSFVGRTGDLAEVQRLLEGSRLVTVTGIGGVGKSRLALEAARLVEAAGETVELVELASLGDADHLVPHVAAVLGVREEPGRDLARTLVEHLRPLPVLLVLDNCEHVVDAAAELVARLLAGCRGVRVLATTQERLRVPGESVWALAPLGVPSPGPATVEELSRSEAVRLFVDRARSVLGDFAVEPDDAEALARICRRLDGIPLAIELAAASVPVLSVAEIAARLDDRFRVLSTGSRTAPERHQSLRAALDWSHAGLSHAEQTLFRRLAVFAGGFSFDAMAEVCLGDGLGAPALEVLSGLVAKSLVQADHGAGTSRYHLLETVRHYAAACLADAGEEALMRDRHTAWATALARRAEPELEGPDQGWWLDLLEREHANLRAALASTRSSPGRGLRLATALGRFWEVRGHLGEGRTWLDDLLAAHDALATPGAPGDAGARARALTVAAVLALRQGDLADARARYGESLVIGRSRGDRLGEAAALHGLGGVASVAGDLAEARRCYEASLSIGRQLGAAHVVAAALTTLGGLALRQLDLVTAWSLLTEALEIQRRTGAASGAAWSLSYLGQVAQARGELDHARALHEESLELRRAVGDRSGIADSLTHLASLAMHEGDLAAARAMHEESEGIRQELGDRAGLMTTSRHLGDVARLGGEHDRATELYHRSLELARELDDPCCMDRARLRLAGVARLRGEPRRARTLYDEAGPAAVPPPVDDVVIDWLEGVAGLALDAGHAEEGARLLGAAAALRAALGAPVPPGERHGRAVDADRAGQALAGPALAAADAEGHLLSLTEAVHLARHVLQVAAPPDSRP